MPITSGFSAEDLARMGPDPLTRKRMLAEALLAKGMGQRKIEHPFQGAAQVAEALVGGLQMRKLDQAQKWGQDRAQASMNELGAALAGPSAFPDAPGTEAKPMSPSYADQRVSQAHGSAIRDGLIRRGLPEHVADAFVMNFKDESNLNPGINEANPIVPGSRGGFGLAQWTGPRRKALEAFAAQRGADVADPELQLDFLMTELQGPESKAAQSIMAAPDAGSAAAAIVNNFLRPAEQHRASREARYLAGGSQAPQNQQVAQALIAPNDAGNVGMPGPGGIVQAQGAFPEPPADPAATLGARPIPQGGPDIQMLMGAAGNPWMNPQQMGIIEALIGQKMSAGDPSKQLDMEYKRAQLDNLRNPRPDPTDDMREYEFAKTQGYDGSFRDFMLDMKKAGATNVTVGGGKYGTIPAGYELRETPEGAQLVPIPGGEAAVAADEAAKAEANRQAATQDRSGLVAEEIDRVLATMDSGILPDTGFGAMLSGVPGTDAKAVSSLLDTIRANIGFDELNKMRQQSPTGGALGQVTERELAFLQSVAGSLDQSQDADQLRYNLNRLWNGYMDVIHGQGQGPERRQLGGAPKGAKSLKDMTDEELEAIINGQP